MRAGLPKSEPATLKSWEDDNVYQNLMKKNEGKPLFVLHDGPPYANGDIHLGTALNKMVDGGVVKVIESKWLGSPVDISNMTVVKAPTSDVATAGSASAASPAPAPEAASGEAAATEGEAA